MTKAKTLDLIDLFCLWTFISGLVIVAMVGCGSDEEVANPEIEKVKDSPPTVQTIELSGIERLVASEEQILALTKLLSPLNRAAMNLSLPSDKAKSLFAPEIELANIESQQSPQAISQYIDATDWSIKPSVKSPPQDIWQPFLDKVKYLNSAKFYFVDGLVTSDASYLDATMGFAAHFVGQDSQTGYAKASMKVRWRLNSKNDPSRKSQIVSWTTTKFRCTRTDHLLFNDVTASVVGARLAAELGQSVHEDMTRRLIQGQAIKPPPGQKYKLFFPEATLEHPAISVVDFDGDGLDDFFLSRIHLPTLMFHNQGDGTFKEVGQSIGLRIDRDCTCALFGDFDNDSDQDVFIGRGRHRAMYFENESGKFSSGDAKTAKAELPYMVSSISAADYNRDGLLDVYFSTYSPIEGNHASIMNDGNQWPKYFLSTIEQVDFNEKRKTAHPYLDMVGPPNILLENRGDEFRISKHAFDVECWRKTFQSSWCDFDQDGDQDLYVCNDFSPDDFFRNDGDEGFVRISDEIGLKIGFAMGVSFQDHNNDGQFDLYVSNMYSKAGTRITRQFDEIDPRFKQLASGNYLYEYDGKNFNLVSGDGPNKTVSKTGWSWGGQMTDLDNDGWHDIVVSNGYYSVPPEVEIKIDF